MIFVDRSRVPCPAVLSDEPSSRASLERREAEKFFSVPLSSRQQGRFRFEAALHPTVRQALSSLFYGKCAYCESKISSVLPFNIERFRPPNSIKEQPEKDGYWWLGSSWSNLLGTCQICNVAKANRFPLVDEARRATKPGDEAHEQPLLLDPCLDHPEEHLVFDRNGTVASETPRGQATIVILQLNRPALVENRRRKIVEIDGLLESRATHVARVKRQPRLRRIKKSIEKIDKRLRSMTNAQEEFAAVTRQLIVPELPKVLGEPRAKRLIGSWDAAVPTITRTRRKRARKAFRTFEKSQSDFSLTDKAGQEKFRMQRREIERVSIQDFKSIKEIDLDFRSEASRSGWLMLLGENGTGKSSVLQAIGMTLAGADYFARVVRDRGLMPKQFIRIGTRKATISVKLSGSIGPHQLVLTHFKATYRKPDGGVAHVILNKGRPYVRTRKGTNAESQSVVLGYGATRLLPRRRAVRYGVAYCRIDNLFDPFLPLFDAERWVSGLRRKAFNQVAIVLKDLLALDPDAVLYRSRGQVFIHAHNTKVPLKQLSDGFQAVVAMSVDILEVAMRLWPRLQDAEGIVLLDEIGSHLHPTWKMKIVDSLRRAFPGMQFVSTTHEPLCLRGLGEGEAIVMRRDKGGRIEALADLPSPSDFRVEQLLTSEFFGLNSTSDPKTDKIFDEYYALLAASKRSGEQSKRLLELQSVLKERRYMGTTLREQLMFEAVDQLVARQKQGERKPLPTLKREAVEAISEAWNQKS